MFYADLCHFLTLPIYKLLMPTPEIGAGNGIIWGFEPGHRSGTGGIRSGLPIRPASRHRIRGHLKIPGMPARISSIEVVCCSATRRAFIMIGGQSHHPSSCSVYSTPDRQSNGERSEGLCPG